MADEVKIRRADIDDIDTIVAIWNEGATRSFGEELPLATTVNLFFRERVMNLQAPFGIWLAVAGSSVMGWQGLQPFRNNPVNECRWAESSTYVSKNARNTGIGRALIRFANKHASENGIDCVVGYIMSSNLSAAHVVETEGWVRVGHMPFTQNQNRDAAYEYWAFVP